MSYLMKLHTHTQNEIASLSLRVIMLSQDNALPEPVDYLTTLIQGMGNSLHVVRRLQETFLTI